PYLALIGFQLVVDWSCGHLRGATGDPRRRKALVAVSVVINLGALCVFKYYGFIARSLGVLGLGLPDLHLTLPLAISFATFESRSYTIAVCRGGPPPVRSPLHLALFITWFPHLIAGPIIRPSELVPQIDRMGPRIGPRIGPHIGPVSRERFFSGLS